MYPLSYLLQNSSDVDARESVEDDDIEDHTDPDQEVLSTLFSIIEMVPCPLLTTN